MRDEQIDRAIDDVAREMTAGEPHGDLRARVVARLDAVGAARRAHEPARAARRLAFAGIAIVAAVVAFRERRPMLRPAPDATAAVRHADAGRLIAEMAGTAHGAAPQATAVSPRPSAIRAAAATRDRRDRPRRFTIAPSPIDALAPPAVAVAPLPVGADLDADPIDVAPLDPIAPIAVAPLGEGDQP